MLALNQLIEWRGKPAVICSDNGPEYINGTFLNWAERQGIRLDHIQPGNPQQNAYIERYNRTVRYDWLSHYLFESIDEVQDYATQWMWTYAPKEVPLGGQSRAPQYGTWWHDPKTEVSTFTQLYF